MSTTSHAMAIARRDATMSGTCAALLPSLLAVSVLWLLLPAYQVQAQTRVQAPTGCPEGTRPRPPGMNPALGPCLPATITADPVPTPTGQRGRGVDMASVDGEIVQPAADEPPLTGEVPPKPGGRPETDPIQFQAPAGQPRPDLALIASFQLANVAIPWGTSANVSADDAASKAGGLCRFRYKYTTRNQGPVGAMATGNRIMRDAQAGPVLAANALPALATGVAANSSGHISLKPGTWMLYVHADAPLLVAESDEANNLRRVRVTVAGKCN